MEMRLILLQLTLSSDSANLIVEKLAAILSGTTFPLMQRHSAWRLNTPAALVIRRVDICLLSDGNPLIRVWGEGRVPGVDESLILGFLPGDEFDFDDDKGDVIVKQKHKEETITLTFRRSAKRRWLAHRVLNYLGL